MVSNEKTVRTVEFLAFLVVVVGVMFIAHKNIVGQYLMAAAQVLWMYVASRKKLIGLFLQSLVLLFVAIYAVFMWQ